MEKPSLRKALGILASHPAVVSIVGAGGKTTTLHALGQELADDGIPALLTTTTHMRREKGCDMSGNAKKILDELKRKNPLLAGIPLAEAPDKLQRLPIEVFRQLCERITAVVVEADGAKCLPFKVPAAHEPAVPRESSHILVLAGMSAIGHPLKSVCHRYALASRWLGTNDDFLLTPKAAGALLEHFYIEPLRADFPNAQVSMLCNQSDDSVKREFARELLAELKNCQGYMTSYQKGELQCIRKYSSR